MKIKKDKNVYLLLIVASFTFGILTKALPVSGQSALALVDMINDGHTAVDDGALDERSHDQVREIQARINENAERLRIEGNLPTPIFGPVRFAWPLRKAPGLSDFNVGFVAAFVDHNLAFPNQLLDWNCGTRTFDGGIINNHRGTDIYSQPFPWKRMYQNEQYAVAAAAGTILLRIDGNFDQNCTVGDPNWNIVVLAHADGSRSWYGHLKNGSVTRKAVGDTISAGEYIGIVGSSGSSRLPHLHFEVYNAANQLQDPFEGACNTMNNFSWWEVQEPYRNSQILGMYTASAIPEFPTCPQQEVTNEKIVFQPLDTLVTVSAYRDQLVGHQTQYSVVRPDGSVLFQWLLVSPQTFDARFWWQTWQLPANAPHGEWKFQATYNSETYERTFFVGQPPDVSVSGRLTTLSGRLVRGGLVVLSGDGVETRTGRTNPFGYYRFDEVPVGETFNVTVSAKGLTFLPRVLLVGGELTDFDHFSLNDQ